MILSSYKILNISYGKISSCRLVKFLSTATNLTNEQIMMHRATLFEKEKERQLKEIERVEKIEVVVDDANKKSQLIMNKYMSTPLNCAMHLSELLMNRSVVALVNGKVWDMNRPLEENCELKFLHFKDEKPFDANNAFWRSCSFVLGYLLETAFKENVKVELCSFPPPDINSGSFIYDANLNLKEWKPSRDELRCLSISAVKLINKNLKFERLRIKADLAKEMFKYNRFKLEQIPQIALKQKENNESNDYVTVYKLGDFVDMSKGPMMSNTSLIGRFEVTGIFNLENKNYGELQRIQGVAIPKQLPLHNWTFNLLAERASKLNNKTKKFQNIAEKLDAIKVEEPSKSQPQPQQS